MLEADASHDLWIWHAFFGLSGANKDLNVPYRSNLFGDVLDDVALECPFTVNGHTYNRGYYLANGIYPTWATFVKSYTIARTAPGLTFKHAQESARKYIERAFGVLQGRWGIICTTRTEFNDIHVSPVANLQRTWIERCDVHKKNRKELRDKTVHTSLRHDLVDHLWQRHLQHQDQHQM
ncbi:ALP1-like protein isoform X1 [Tanacetum coccineum]